MMAFGVVKEPVFFFFLQLVCLRSFLIQRELDLVTVDVRDTTIPKVRYVMVTINLKFQRQPSRW